MKRATSATLALILTATTFAAAQTPNSIRYSNTTPAAPTGAANVQWQNDNSSPTTNISAYALYPTLQVACPASGDLGAPINAALAALPAATGGTVDARRCSAATTITTPITFTLPHTALLLPCATLTTAQTITIAATAHNSLIAGCAYSAGSPVSGSSAGTLISYTGSTAALVAGDPTHVELHERPHPPELRREPHQRRRWRDRHPTLRGRTLQTRLPLHLRQQHRHTDRDLHRRHRLV